MTSLAYPWFLLLLIPLALLAIHAWRRPKPSIRQPSAEPFAKAGKMVGGRGRILYGIPFFLYVAATALLIVALARPRHGEERVAQRAEGIDIMIAIDLSGSMQSVDIPDDIRTENDLRAALRSGRVSNRLEVSKAEIRKFIAKRPNDRIGLTGFAPLPYNISPPTLDHSWLTEHLRQLRPGVIGDATNIAGPVASAVNRLKDADSKRRVIVLFTDGSNNVSAKITPRQAAKLASQYDITIYTVGIGSPRAGVFANTLFGEKFVPVDNEFDEALLKDMASTTGGKYYRAFDAAGLEKVMNDIDKMEKTSVVQPRVMNYSEHAPRMACVSLALLLLGFLLESTVLLRIP